MPLKISLAAIGEKGGWPGVDFDTDSAISLPTPEGSVGRSTASSQQPAPQSHSHSSDPEVVLALTDDVLAVAKGLFALVDAKYAEEELLEVEPARDEDEVVDCLDDARCLNKVATAKNSRI